MKPKKSLSQRFLRSRSIREEILNAADISEEDVVLEIGAGTGELTTGLAEKARHVIAVEVDSALLPFLRDALASFCNVSVICESILDVDLNKVAADYERDRLIVVGNLPYHLTTQIILYLIERRDVINRATLTVQKEYAARLLAPPGGRDYGAITLRAGYNARVKKVTDVPSSAFYPRPKVDSTVVTLSFRESPAVDVADETFMFRMIRQAFGQRRKMLVNSLSGLSGSAREDVKKICSSVGVDPNRRPETLTLEDFARLSDAFCSSGCVPMGASPGKRRGRW